MPRHAWEFRDRTRSILRMGLLLLVAGALPLPARGGPAGQGSSEAVTGYIEVSSLNVGLDKLNPPLDLDTPQATIEEFINSCRRGDDYGYERAAHAMDLNAIAPERQLEVGKVLARQLKEVMDQQVWFDWSDVPDRPDGLDENDPVAKPGQAPPPDRPRASFLLYQLFIGDRDFEIRLERLKAPDALPVWVFSKQTVRHIPTLYREFQPSRLQRTLPTFLKERKFLKVALWQWIGFTVLVLAGAFSGWIVQKALNLTLRWTNSPWLRTIAEAVRGPGALTIGLWLFYDLAQKFLGLSGSILSVLKPFYVAILTASLIWFLQRLIRLITARVSLRYAGYDSDEGNVLITQISVLRHVLTFLVLIGGAAYILSGFESVRRFGTAILASAGVAGLIMGVAAQRVLGNLFSGLLLAIVQPVKAGDAIIFENEFGWIEEISITYLVIRTWDKRRLIVPISYFMDHPFQNWSRGSQQIIKPVVVHADYRLDVDVLREELKSILEETDLWDRDVPPILHVTDCTEGTIALRALCSARDPAASWDLHCLIRERLVQFLRDLDDGRYLPRRRVVLVDGVHAEGMHAEEGHEGGAGHNGAAPATRPDGEGVRG